jgi:nucleoside-diphosphate-sugar epimerase
MEHMNILITGNTGYIGPVLIRHLRQTLPHHRYAGFDNGYFAHVLTGASRLPETQFDAQYWGDLREFPNDLLDSVDVLVHLAAISNDPMGNRFGPVTEAINDKASRALAAEAKRRGVRSFVLASSCSMYGYAEGAPRDESSTLNPLTAYARSKVSMEKALQGLADDKFIVTSLRFATACGMSDRLRLDLVLNDFVACAMTTGEITILSDGTPWRPLIDVADMSRAIEWAIRRQPGASGPAFVAANIGKTNYQVIDLARAVAAAIPGTRISVNPDAAPDKRSYQVDFSLFQSIAPAHQPQVSLRQSIEELKSGMERMNFADGEFRSSDYMRLKVLERHVQRRRLTDDLRWTGTP